MALAAEKNPLKNPVVLNHLFELCPAPVLATSRQISKQWYDASLSSWRKFPVTITPRTSLDAFRNLSSKPGNMLATKPYRNAIFSEIEFGSISADINFFWNGIRSNLHILTLYRCTFTNVREFRQVIYSSCPLLEKLTIDYHFRILKKTAPNREENRLHYREHEKLTSLEIARSERDPTMLPVSWTELFAHFPSLTSLNVSYITDADFDILIDAINAIRLKDPTKLRFKSFQLHPKLTISNCTEMSRKFENVKELRLPITDCVIEVYPELQKTFLRNSLKYLAASVNTIILTKHGNTEADQIPTWFQDFPFEITLNKLRRLESKDGVLHAFSFLRFTPNLQIFDNQASRARVSTGSFTLPTGGIPSSCKEELANFLLLSLTTLKLELLVSDDDIQHLIKWLPNIRNLKMTLSDPQFVVTCQNWKELRQLEVSGYELTVEGTTQLEKGRKAREEGNVTFLPSIANLKVLKKLDIRPLWSTGFTSEPVHHLFLHMPTLLDFLTCDYAVNRKIVDVVSYQRAIEGDANAYEQWKKNNYHKPGEAHLSKNLPGGSKQK